ncbi:hypothetical protein SAMN04489735_100234 [Aneurinibacillus thermoaerophilus]|uniref:Uncharacterized protein n=1 Tax=Aneurinibacillus thermoaerophilus TaxID=143495 RepID=A0A1G7WNY2_ANETH|nr:hypothetical protein [Aneurinibacillus thermoaerophilus]SDG73623.1 hypothetical protein SAMN04489735_100234 [Aneurinibacillus thermoaerophilus]
MPKYYPNRFTGELLEASKVWAKNKTKLREEGYITDFFKPNCYNGQDYYILRKEENGEYQFTKVSRFGTKNKLQLLLLTGWEIIKEPEPKLREAK